jgi:hypothetical protein
MSALVELPMEDGTSLLVETAERSGPAVRGGHPDGTVATAATTFEAAMDRVAPASRAIVERLRGGPGPRASEIVVEFGLVVRAEVGLVISKAGGEANFVVRVTWQQER